MKQLSRLFATLAMICMLAGASTAANLTGTFKTPNTSVPLRNATVTLTLNQSAVVPSSFSIVPTPVSCYTSVDGAIKGLPNPLVIAGVSNNTSSGSIAAGTYYVRVTYTASGVETLVSPSQSTVLSGTGQILVNAPVLQPSNATGYNVYVGTVDGSEKLQATTTGFGSTTVTSYNSGAAAVPGSNTSVCSVQFNDAMIPAPTTYRVSVVDANGSTVPGFPQQWYLAGSSFDISNGYPVASNVQTRFPQPIIANPSSNALQSINSPVTFNGYDSKPGATVFTGLTSHSLSSSGQAALWYDTTQNKLLVSVNGGAATDVLTLAPALPLTQTQGGTNRSGAITANQLVYSDGSAYQGTSSLNWDNTKIQLTATGRFILKSATQQNPPSNSGALEMYYNASGDNGAIYAAADDGSGGGSTKPLYFDASALHLAVGSTLSALADALLLDGSKNATFYGGISISTGATVAAGYVGLGRTTVGSLPAAAAGNAGMMIEVTDSTAVAAEGQTCVGSGAVVAMAFSNGTVWKCF